MDFDEIFEKIKNKEITICETCDTIFDYVPQKRFCAECVRRKACAKTALVTQKKEDEVRKEHDDMTPEEKAALWLRSGKAPKGTTRTLKSLRRVKNWTMEDTRKLRKVSFNKPHHNHFRYKSKRIRKQGSIEFRIHQSDDRDS